MKGDCITFGDGTIYPIKLDPKCPQDEIRFEDADGKCVATIVNVGGRGEMRKLFVREGEMTVALWWHDEYIGFAGEHRSQLLEDIMRWAGVEPVEDAEVTKRVRLTIEEVEDDS